MADNGNGNMGLVGWVKQFANLSAVAVALFLLYGLVEDLKVANRDRLLEGQKAHERVADLTRAVEHTSRSMDRLVHVVDKLTKDKDTKE